MFLSNGDHLAYNLTPGIKCLQLSICVKLGFLFLCLINSVSCGKTSDASQWFQEMAEFNPTLRLISSDKNKAKYYMNVEKLDGVRLRPGIIASNVAQLREKMTIKAEDVIICTYPKCGTTWMQQIVKLIANNGVETLVNVDVCVPWMELMSLTEIESMSSPRFFKTHLPYQLMAGGGDPANTNAKYIYVLRNPKDVAVSSYNFYEKVFLNFLSITWESYLDAFLEGDVSFGAFYSHYLGWWLHKDASNILFLSYEQMKRDLSSVVTRVSSFLGYNLTDEVIQTIVKQSHFDNMKNNSSANKEYINPYTPGKTPFMRKGVIGDWRNVFTEEQSAKMDAVITDKLRASGLEFDYGDD